MEERGEEVAKRNIKTRERTNNKKSDRIRKLNFLKYKYRGVCLKRKTKTVPVDTSGQNNAKT